ncbi:MAG TPA: HAD-IIB family hydrolase [Gemmatimonadales bacterium]|nr:HAD-IIB family hydrolase [Gemmatimonadales bacterium]
MSFTSGASSAVLLASDVDGTFWPSGVPLARLREAFAARSEGVQVLFVSSRTVPELDALTAALGCGAEFIAENGAVIVTGDPDIAVHLRGARREALGARRAFVAAFEGSPRAIAVAIREARRIHGAPVQLVAELSPAERREALGDESATHDATARRASVLVRADWSSSATLSWATELREAGLRVAAGGHWTVVWEGADKGEALRTYVAARAAAGHAPGLVAAVGDAENDASLLGAAVRRFAMPRGDGTVHPALRAVPGVEVAPAAGTRGWLAVTATLGSAA